MSEINTIDDFEEVLERLFQTKEILEENIFITLPKNGNCEYVITKNRSFFDEEPIFTAILYDTEVYLFEDSK